MGKLAVVALGPALEGSGEVAALFADGDDIAEHAGEKWLAAQGGSERGPLAHALDDGGEELLEVDIAGGVLEEREGVEQCDAVVQERGERLAELGEELAGEDATDERNAEFELIPHGRPSGLRFQVQKPTARATSAARTKTP